MAGYEQDEDWGLARVRASGICLELTPRISNILGLPQLATREQIAAAVQALGGWPSPRRTDTRELLAAAALIGDEQVDGFRHLRSVDPELDALRLGMEGDQLAQDLLEELRPADVRGLAQDLALSDTQFATPRLVAEHPGMAVRKHIASVLDLIVRAAWFKGWLGKPSASPQELAAKKLAKHRSKPGNRQTPPRKTS